MLRASLALLLLGASAVVYAQNGRSVPNDNATLCQEVAERAVAERAGDAVSAAPEASRARATVVRSKYSVPAPAPVSAPRGGGDDDESPLPRSRGSKWHSFLPGMFR